MEIMNGSSRKEVLMVEKWKREYDVPANACGHLGEGLYDARGRRVES
jgi:hypothetical protein